MSSTTTDQKDKQEKHPVLLHAMYNKRGSVCPYKCGGWMFLFVLIIFICVVASRSSGKDASVVNGGGATVRTLAPSADELLSELSSTISF